MARAILPNMERGWTRKRSGEPRPLVRSPVPERPEIHQIVLPLPPGAGRAIRNVQIHLIEGDPLTLVDTGTRLPESRAVLESALEELGYGIADIERVVLTHAHSDHMGLVQSIRETGASLECWVHQDDARLVEAQEEILRGRAAGASQLFREFGVPEAMLARFDRERGEVLREVARQSESTTVERILREGDRIAFKHFDLLVHHSPGHTPGHILLEEEESQILFTGDQVMGQAVPNTENHYVDFDINADEETAGQRAGDGAKRQGAARRIPVRAADARKTADPLHRRARFRGLLEVRRSLQRLRSRRFRLLLPAYGGVIQRSDRTIRDTLLYYDVRLQRIDRGLRHLAALGQEVTAFEIWKSLFPQDGPYEVMRDQLLLVIGALDCLEDEGKLETARRSDGVLTHHHV